MQNTNHPEPKEHSKTLVPGAALNVLRRAVLASLGLALLTACAASPAARDKLIQQRAEARWAALLARDYAQAYAFSSPGYRSGASVVDFEIEIRSRRVQYTSAEYQGHSCEDAVCTVSMRVSYQVVRPAPGVPKWESSSVIEERWINTEGNWWFVPRS